MPSQTANPEINRRVKEILRRDLKLGPGAEIEDDMPLIGGEFDIDSLDVVLLVSSIEKEFDIKLPKQAASTEVFQDVGSMVRFLQTQTQGQVSPETDGDHSEHQPSPASQGPNTEASPSADDENLNRLLACLPHAQPFRFVSQLTSAEPGVRAQGVWQITGDEAFFAGHFPAQPLVPGVLISEALAQLSGLVQPAQWDQPGGPANNGHSPSANKANTVNKTSPASNQRVLAQVNVQFKQPVTPPANIALYSRLDRSMPPMDHFNVHAMVDGAVVAEGELTLHCPAG